MEQEDREGQVKVGGMIQIDPMNPPLPQTLRDWLLESYPDRLAKTLREASKAHEELVYVAVLLVEGYSQSQSDSTQTSEKSSDSGARRNVSRRVRPGLDETELFVEIENRKVRRKQYNFKRHWSRAWQAVRTAGHYPAAYSLSYLERELPPVVEVPMMSTCQRRVLFKDPFMVTPPPQLPATAATPQKLWSFKEFTSMPE